VTTLGAVEPDGLGVGNADGVGELTHVGGGHEAGVELEGGVRGGLLNGNAGLGEVGHGHRVVLLERFVSAIALQMDVERGLVLTLG